MQHVGTKISAVMSGLTPLRQSLVICRNRTEELSGVFRLTGAPKQSDVFCHQVSLALKHGVSTGALDLSVKKLERGALAFVAS